MPASDSDEDVRRQSDVALDGPLREREEYVLKAIAQRHGISRTVSNQLPTGQTKKPCQHASRAQGKMPMLLPCSHRTVPPATTSWHHAAGACQMKTVY